MSRTIPKVLMAVALVATAAAVGWWKNNGKQSSASGVSVPTASEHSSEGPSARQAMPDAARPPTKQEVAAAQAPAREPVAPGKADNKGEVKVDPASIRFGLRDPKPRTPGTIRVATFNIENLFDDKDDPKLTGSGDDKDMTKPRADRAAAAAAIRRVDADVLALQEVESLEALLWFRDEFLKDMGYVHVQSIDAGDGRGIEQSVLSRYPLSDAKVYNRMKLGGRQPDRWGNNPNSEAGSPFEFKRSPMQVTVTVPSSSVGELLAKAGTTQARAEDYKITLFVCHLKSGREFDEQRGAEAKGVISLVQALEKEKPGANVLILGDFNATLNQPALQHFVQAGMPSIFNDRQPRDPQTMTHTTGRCIDHIYYNAAIKPELVMDSRFVLGLPARPEGADWRTTPAPAGYASDHYPVVIDIKPVDRK